MGEHSESVDDVDGSDQPQSRDPVGFLLLGAPLQLLALVLGASEQPPFLAAILGLTGFWMTLWAVITLAVRAATDRPVRLWPADEPNEAGPAPPSGKDLPTDS